MGAYTCQFGVVHKMCRCPKPHKISCNTPELHRPVEEEYEPKHRKDDDEDTGN
jgi:hypothetical protein